MSEASRDLRDSIEYHSAEAVPVLQRHADEMEAMAAKYTRGEFSELDAKYQMQRTYNARRGKQKYDEALRRKTNE